MDVPQIIAGRFKIEREIGTGGMGTVYLATHLGLERPVAVKIIRREFAGDADVADRFLREAKTMAKLRHPNAAMIFDAGILPDSRHFIVMEFVEGETLSQALAREGRFPASKAVRIATEICDVLEEAHLAARRHRRDAVDVAVAVDVAEGEEVELGRRDARHADDRTALDVHERRAHRDDDVGRAVAADVGDLDVVVGAERRQVERQRRALDEGQ